MNNIKKTVAFKEVFELKIKSGVDTLSNAVKTTMGPKGKLVLIQKGNQHPIVTKDGVTVAMSINLEDELENLGAKIIKEAAARTAEQAGDGTTSSTVLAQSIYNEGMKMKSAGYQTDLLIKGIDMSVSVIKNCLLNNKKDIESNEELLQVATISANGEEDIAKLIVEAIDKAGPEGSVIVEEAKGYNSTLDFVEGFNLERGYLSPYFITDKNKMTCIFEKPLLLIADCDFTTIHQLMKPLETALEANRPILIIANDIIGDALQGLVINKTKGNLRVCAIKSPGFGNARHEMLHDLLSITGGTIIDSSFDMKEFSISDFGTCQRIIIHKNSSMLISKKEKNNNSLLYERVTSIKDRLKNDYSINENEEKILKYRLKQLSGGIAILRIGAATESELIERYDRVDDALNATKAALEEGILPGGGVALARTLKDLNILKNTEEDSDIKAGIEILIRSVMSPFKQIVENGPKSSEAVLSKILNQQNNAGYDAKNDVYGDMYEIGIVDPHKVIRCSIENAAAAAKILLNTGCCMVDMNYLEDVNSY